MSPHRIKRAEVLAPGRIRHPLRVAGATSTQPQRDEVLLLLGLTCGMRITQTAQVTVDGICFPSGRLRHEVSLRAATTKGCRQRCVNLAIDKLIAALERDLEYGVARSTGATLERTRYRSLHLYRTRAGPDGSVACAGLVATVGRDHSGLPSRAGQPSPGEVARQRSMRRCASCISSCLTIK
jgi:hypothetical protein